MSDTPKTDAVWAELSKLKSTTLRYPCETRLTELARELERDLNRLRKVLQEIANEDYRGNRSLASIKAFNALKQ